MIEKLQAHYGFNRTPFGRDLAPGMLHRHASHNEAIARIQWCISERSIGVVTGEVGAGKTVSVRTVLSSLDPSKHTVIYLPNPQIGIRGIHEEIVTAFGQTPSHLGSRLISQTGKALLAEREERGRTPVLVLDEAHLLTYEQLETIRMLTNQSMDQHSPLACLLVGQPTLRRTMKLVGRPDQLFTDDAIGLIHSTARGYPRAVNNLSLQALVAAFAAAKSLVDETAARAAVSEVVV